MEQPLDALLIVAGVALICIILIHGIGQHFVKQTYEVPCVAKKVSGFNTVQYQTMCEVES